jgi:tRNA U34 2-thiouridine synthase MnmA/TrmU
MRTPDAHVIESIRVCSISLSASARDEHRWRTRLRAGPWYVVGKDVAHNVLYVDQGTDRPWLHSQALWSEAAHWIDGAPPAQRFTCTAQTTLPPADDAARCSYGTAI